MSVWNQDRLGGMAGKRFMLGLWDPRHKMVSSAYVPGTVERRKLLGKTPFSYVLNFPVNTATGGTANDRFTVTSDFWLTTLLASYAGYGGYPPVLGFTFSLFETKTKRRFMSLPAAGENFGGGPMLNIGFDPPLNFPFYCRKIIKIPAGSNMSALAKVVPEGVGTSPLQVVLGGYVD